MPETETEMLVRLKVIAKPAGVWCEISPEDSAALCHALALIERYRGALEAYDPPLPPALEGETDDQYTDRLTGADGGTPPYPEHRNRQYSIGFHNECSDPDGRRCKCPCHQFEELRRAALTSDPTPAPAETEVPR